MIAFRQSEGWQLYNSAEGYPYYFNDLSGVSEWATDGTYYLTIENEQVAIMRHEYLPSDLILFQT